MTCKETIRHEILRFNECNPKANHEQIMDEIMTHLDVDEDNAIQILENMIDTGEITIN